MTLGSRRRGRRDGDRAAGGGGRRAGEGSAPRSTTETAGAPTRVMWASRMRRSCSRSSCACARRRDAAAVAAGADARGAAAASSRVHHALFYVPPPARVPARGARSSAASRPDGLVGLVAFASGVAALPCGRRSLGTALSPLVTPHPARPPRHDGRVRPRPAPHVPRPAPHRGRARRRPSDAAGRSRCRSPRQSCCSSGSDWRRMRSRRPMGSIAVIASAQKRLVPFVF